MRALPARRALHALRRATRAPFWIAWIGAWALSGQAEELRRGSSWPSGDRQPSPTREVRVIAIGSALDVAELQTALENDVPKGFVLRATQAQVFNRSAFLRGSSVTGAHIEVWIDAQSPKHVQLYFVNRKVARYALRSLSLSGSMNEIDLEALGQAIAWSLRALAEGADDTISQAEAESLIIASDKAKADGGPDTKRAPSGVRADETDAGGQSSLGESARVSPGPLQAALSAFYRASFHSRELGLVHGPGLGAGMNQISSGRILSLDGSVQWQLPAEHEESGVGLGLMALANRFDFGFRKKVGARARLGGQAGLGIDGLWVSPYELSRSEYGARDSSFVLATLLHLAFWAQVKLSPRLWLDLKAGAEADFSSSRFLLVSANGQTVFAERLPVRPTATVGLSIP